MSRQSDSKHAPRPGAAASTGRVAKRGAIEVPRGLADVVVDVTAISHVDGDRGRLIYRGRDLATLVELPFLDVAGLVARGAPDRAWSQRMMAAASLTEADTARVLAMPDDVHPMHVLQAIVPVLDRTAAADLGDGEAGDGFAIAAKLPAVIATLLLRRPVALVGDDTVSAFLRAAEVGGAASHRHAFSVTQILQLEHSFNASTFTARVVSSTLAPIENGIAAAFGALHGTLHGGADQAALAMADGIGTPAAAAAFVDGAIKSRMKVMGMGHREYRVYDPRARYVRAFAEELTRGTAHEETFAVLAAVEARFAERMAEQGKALHPNLEFYKGLVYRAIGFPDAYFTALFALARVFGYIAHILESRTDNRIFRPAARYIGADVA